MARGLTTKQRRFVDVYDGNATDAARKAGYKGNARTLQAVGAENLAKPIIANAIAAREEKRAANDIATREERQRFWSDVLRGKFTDDEGGADFKDRLKASELLGKSEADFTDKIAGAGPGGEHLVGITIGWGKDG